MDGILLVFKPIGKTSRDVVNEISRKFDMKKVGHAGTLDPFADGLLLITLGKGTKTTTFFENLDKEYVASLKLGEKTDTLDLTGNLIETKKVKNIETSDIEEVFKSLVGDLKQTPPMYSALKHNGKPLYKYAREGVEIDRKERDIKIYEMKLISFKDNIITFSVRCSKGTYIRTLGEQIAERLGSIGHLVALRRTSIGDFSLNMAKSLEDISKDDLISVSKALTHIKQVKITDEAMIKAIKDGKIMNVDEKEEVIFFVDGNDEALSIYKKLEDGRYICLRGLF